LLLSSTEDVAQIERSEIRDQPARVFPSPRFASLRGARGTR
jgi:hypothetical protein